MKTGLRNFLSVPASRSTKAIDGSAKPLQNTEAALVEGVGGGKAEKAGEADAVGEAAGRDRYSSDPSQATHTPRVELPRHRAQQLVSQLRDDPGSLPLVKLGKHQKRELEQLAMTTAQRHLGEGDLAAKIVTSLDRSVVVALQRPCENKPLAFYKLCAGADECIDETRAAALLESAKLVHGRACAMVALQRVQTPNGGEKLAYLVESARGTSLNDRLMATTSDALPQIRHKMLKVAKGDLEKLGQALAELHSQLPSQGLVEHSQKQREVKKVTQQLSYIQSRIPFLATPIGPEQLQQAAKVVQQRAEPYLAADIPASVVHGDMHPENCFLDDGIESNQITFIDNESMLRSVNQKGQGKLAAGIDVVRILESMSSRLQNKLRPGELENLRQAFLQSYNKHSSQDSDSLQIQRSFFTPLRAIKSIFNICKQLEEKPGDAGLTRRLNKQFATLSRIVFQPE